MKSTTCINCNTEFHSRHRLFRHLTNRPAKNKCASAYDDIEPMSFDELKEFEAKIPPVDRKAFPPPPVKLA